MSEGVQSLLVKMLHACTTVSMFARVQHGRLKLAHSRDTPVRMSHHRSEVTSVRAKLVYCIFLGRQPHTLEISLGAYTKYEPYYIVRRLSRTCRKKNRRTGASPQPPIIELACFVSSLV